MALKNTWIDRVDGVDDVKASDPNEIAHAVIELENTQLPKETSSGSNRVYGVSTKGIQTMFDAYSASVRILSLMLRDSTGHCKIIPPVSDNDIANKKYVDDSLGNTEASLDAIIAIQESLIGGES